MRKNGRHLQRFRAILAVWCVVIYCTRLLGIEQSLKQRERVAFIKVLFNDRFFVQKNANFSQLDGGVKLYDCNHLICDLIHQRFMKDRLV